VVKVQGWQGLAVMQKGTGVQGECRVGLGPSQNPAWASILLLHARCLRKWPKEKSFQILKIPLVDLIHIFIGMEWWWWWSIWCCFASFQKVGHLHIFSKSPLVKCILVNLVNFSHGGQHESGSP
jgi:hypothetical protein